MPEVRESMQVEEEAVPVDREGRGPRRQDDVALVVVVVVVIVVVIVVVVVVVDDVSDASEVSAQAVHSHGCSTSIVLVGECDGGGELVIRQ